VQTIDQPHRLDRRQSADFRQAMVAASPATKSTSVPRISLIEGFRRFL
jgi:hypothetical protein